MARRSFLAGLGRWRRTLIVLTVLVLLAVSTRIALPYILRWQLETQASKALNAQVEIGDVDLALYRGGVALIDVAVRPLAAGQQAGAVATSPPTPAAAAVAGRDGADTPRAAPPAQNPPSAPPTTPPAATPIVLPKEIAADSGDRGSPDAATAVPPIVAWKRFAVELHWRPLFDKVVRLREVVLESPYVAVDRLDTGAINLTALVPASSEEPPAQGTPAPEAAPDAASPGWAFGIDRLALREGNVRFRDFMIKDFEPVDLGLGTIEVRDIAIQPETYGQPAHLHLEMKVDDGVVRIDADATVKGANAIALVANVVAENLPLRRSRVYIPNVGWSDLQGRLAANVKYELETLAKNQVSGTVALQDVSVRVPDIDLPAIAWKSFEVKVDTVDLMAQRAAVSSVILAGASIPTRPFGDEPFPLLRRATGTQGAPAAPAAPAPSPAVGESAPSEGEPAASETKPWQWSLASVQVTDATAHVLGGTAPMDVGIDVEVRDLSSAFEKPATVQLAVGLKEGSLNVDGAVRLEPIGFNGRVKIQKLDLVEPLVIGRALPPNVLQSGQLGVDLAVQAGSAAPQPGDVRVSGTISLAKPRVAAENPKDFVAGASSIDVSIKQVDVPAVIPPHNAAAAKGPIGVQLAELRVAAPELQLTRTAEGLVLPNFSATTSGEPSAQSEPQAQPTPAPAAEVAPATPGAPAAAPVDLTIGSFRITQGRIGVTDRSVKPFYVGKIAPLNVDAQGVRWPEIAVNKLRLDATSAQQGKLEVTGSLAPTGGQFEVNVRDFGLVPFNSYATTYSPYSVAKGSLTVTTKGSFGKGTYKADSKITLHDLDLGGQGGESVFQEQFGIPLSMALALLRDVEGNIVLDLPVAADEEGTKVGIATVVGGVLRRAIVNALASPLKLFGAVMQGDKVQSLAPPIIQFRVGREEFAADGAERAKQLGAFLSTRPVVQVNLETVPTTMDVRWLREQAVRAELEEPQGFFGTIRNIGQGGTREKIRAALEARANDEKGELDAEAAKTLEEWLAERPPIAPERLAALADGRLARVEAVLREQSGITAERVTRASPPAELSDDAPVVRVEIGTGSGDTPSEDTSDQAEQPASGE